MKANEKQSGAGVVADSAAPAVKGKGLKRKGPSQPEKSSDEAAVVQIQSPVKTSRAGRAAAKDAEKAVAEVAASTDGGTDESQNPRSSSKKVRKSCEHNKRKERCRECGGMFSFQHLRLRSL